MLSPRRTQTEYHRAVPQLQEHNSPQLLGGTNYGFSRLQCGLHLPVLTFLSGSFGRLTCCPARIARRKARGVLQLQVTSCIRTVHDRSS